MSGVRRADLVLMAVLLLLSGAVFAWNLRSTGEAPARVEIREGNSVRSIHPLNQNETIVIDEDHRHNVIVIENGVVHMESANCRDQLCLGMGEIEQVGESIVCLPNRISVRILGQEEGEIDALSQ